MINRRILTAFAFAAALTVAPLAATDFSFSSIMRAGARGIAAGGWEIGTGADLNSITSGTQYRYSNIRGWSNNLDQQFRIGYDQATNTAFTTVWGSTGIEYTSSFNPVGGNPLNSGGTWTIKANALNLTADPAVVPPTSILVSQLQFGNGLNVLQPLTSTTLFASQPTGNSQVGNSAPVVFSAFGSGGNWYLDGIIRFSGLTPYVANGATNSDLRFSLTASAADTPEPAAVILFSTGVLAMAVYKRRKKDTLA
ncbi:MAG: PEP-CTERM sorting domain-containing protein [Acidobacteria bacterium]|nr:PEP-CTERM sorting domain-containing protein [Acidobacteriota bacterium]